MTDGGASVPVRVAARSAQRQDRVVVEGAVLHDQGRHRRRALLLEHGIVPDAQPDLRDELHLRLVQQLGLRHRIAGRGELLGMSLREADSE